jgi:hypothetical protein
MERRIDLRFYEIAEKYKENGQIPIKFFKRFLDDIFLIFLGTVQKLHEFFKDINNIHEHIKFTMSHTTPQSEFQKPPSCSCPQMESIPYLDTSCQIKQGKIITDLYRKPTDKKNFFLHLAAILQSAWTRSHFHYQ